MKKARGLRFDRLYGHIMLLFLIVLIPAVVLGIYSYTHTERTALRNAEQTVQRQVTHAVQEIDKRLEDISAMYQVLVNNRELRGLELAERPDAADTTRMINTATLLSDLVMLNDILAEIVLYTGADKVVSTSGIYPADYYFGDYHRYEGYTLDTWRALIAGRGSMRYLAPVPMRVKTVNRYSSYTAIPVVSALTTNHGRGMLIFVIDAQRLVDTLVKYIPYTHVQVAIDGPDGPIVAGMAAEDVGELIEFVYASPQNAWRYTVGIPRREITTTSQQMLSQVLMIIVSVLAFGVILVMMASRYLYQPLGSIQAMLSEEMRQQGPGKPGGSLDALEAQVSRLLQSSSSNEARVGDLARVYAESVFLSQAMTENKASTLETIMQSHLGFHGGPYQCAALWFAEKTPAREAGATELLGRYFPIISLGYSDEISLFVFEIDTPHQRAVLETAARELFRRQPDAIVGIAVGNEIDHVKDLHRSLNASLTMLQQLAPDDRDRLLFAEDFDIASQYVYTHRDEWTLVEALQRGEADRLHQLLDKILLHNYERLVSHQQIQHLFEQLRNTAYRYAQQENIPVPPHAYDRTASFDVTREALHTLYGMLLTDTDARTRGVHLQLVTDADAYILTHYDQDIYLDTIADALGVSAKHLSRVYKQHRGMNITDQICAVRIDRAKELLLGTDLAIQDVMRQTGFVSRATFLRSFKKYVGLSPSVYRHMHNPASAVEGEEEDG